MPLARFGHPLNIRPLGGYVQAPSRQQVAPPTLVGRGRSPLPQADTPAKTPANFRPIRPPISPIQARSPYLNQNAPRVRDFTVGAPMHRPAPAIQGQTIGGGITAQRIPTPEGDPTVVRADGTPRVMAVRRVVRQNTAPRPAGQPTATVATPGYTPRAETIELVEDQAGTWGPSATPATLTQPNTGGSLPDTSMTVAAGAPNTGGSPGEAVPVVAAAIMPAPVRSWTPWIVGGLVVIAAYYAWPR